MDLLVFPAPVLELPAPITTQGCFFLDSGDLSQGLRLAQQAHHRLSANLAQTPIFLSIGNDFRL